MAVVGCFFSEKKQRHIDFERLKAVARFVAAGGLPGGPREGAVP